MFKRKYIFFCSLICLSRVFHFALEIHAKILSFVSNDVYPSATFFFKCTIMIQNIFIFFWFLWGAFELYSHNIIYFFSYYFFFLTLWWRVLEVFFYFQFNFSYFTIFFIFFAFVFLLYIFNFEEFFFLLREKNMGLSKQNFLQQSSRRREKKF